MHRAVLVTIAVVAVALTLTGCATKKYVNAELAEAEARSDERLDARVNEVESQVEAAENLVATLARLSRGANLVLLGAPSHRFQVATDLADRIAERLDCPALLIHTPVVETMSFQRRLIERFIS